jgi:polar amino acid transport system permease protein
MDVAFIIASLPRVLPAFGLTILITAIALVLGTVVGVALGTARSLAARRSLATLAIDAWVGFVRGTPIIVQIFIAYFLLPEIGIRLPAFWVGAIALAFNSAGYQIEIARAAVSSIPVGQWDGARSLGLGRAQTLRLVILPQAVRRMMPGLVNEASQLVKASSVLSVIAVFELHKAASAIMADSFKFLEMLALQAILYLAIVLALEWGAGRLERRLSGAVPAGTATTVR